MILASPERLLSLLVRNPEGVSRAAAAARAHDPEAAVRTLLDRGHALAAAGEGWRLACARLHFDPEAFAAACTVSPPRFEVWESTASTNDLARDAADAGAPGGALFLAESQTAGRGRQGRAWLAAPHQGLLVSWIERGPLGPAARPTWLPLAAGLGICEALVAATGMRIDLKWPNDLLLAGRKLAGLLVEARHGGFPYAVVGLGINVHPGGTAGVQPAAAALGGEVRRELLLARLLEGAWRRIGDWRAGRVAELRAAWLQHDVVVGSRVRCQTVQGEVEGRARTIGEDGLLHVATARGAVVALAAAEVHLL
jgi:BirA family biotin operon repressor/biotin-[acetyl-CoA-carboxylase] ligase